MHVKLGVTHFFIPALLIVGSFLNSAPARAFSEAIHEEITRTIFGELGFTPKAISDVVHGNLRTDKDEWKKSAAHFDNEEFSRGSARLRERFAQAIDAARTGNFKEARKQIGRCLHGIQDFYAHSNYAENRDTLGEIDLFQLADPLPEAVCDANKRTGPLSSGYFPKESRPAPWKCTHKELNKDRPKNAYHFEALALAQAGTRKLYQDVVDRLTLEVGSTEAAALVLALKAPATSDTVLTIP